jgi:hypothetical protein
MVAIMWLITGIATPLFGLTVDFFGKRTLYVSFSSDS